MIGVGHGRLDELSCYRRLSRSKNYPGLLFALGLGLSRHSVLQSHRDRDVADLNGIHRDAPVGGFAADLAAQCEEYVKKVPQHRAAARLARVVPYDFDNEEKLDPMALLEEVTQHFYRKAKIEESLGRFCDFRIVDNALQNAARIAREIVSFKHPRISAIKLAVADPNADLLRGDMTADEMREIIRRKLEDEGLLPPRQVVAANAGPLAKPLQEQQRTNKRAVAYFIQIISRKTVCV